MAALPRQAKRQVEEANRLIEELNKVPEQPVPVATASETPAPPAPAPAPVEEPTTPEPVSAPPPQVAEAPPAPPPAPVVDWEHKYKVLQGKYNSEVPELTRENSFLRQENQQLRQPPPAPVAAPIAEPLVSQAEVQEYGQDLVDLMRRVAREESRSPGSLQPVLDRIGSLEKQVGNVSQHAQRAVANDVFATLDREIKDWRAINEDPRFLEWLQERDPYSGEVRGKLLRDAHGAGNAPRVAAFFQGFLREYATVTRDQPGSVSPQVQTAPVNGSPQVDLGSLVAPGTPRATTVGAQPQKRIWTGNEIQQFYDDAKRGRYNRDPAQRIALERDIVAAAAEGRIRN